MFEELSSIKIDIKRYERCFSQIAMPSEYFKFFKGVELSASYAFNAYWLSLVNCAITISNNPLCLTFCRSPFFTKNKDKDKVGINGLSNDRIAEECFYYAKSFFNSQEVTETLYLHQIFPDYAFFQHFNHVLAKVDKNMPNKTHFPTLALDWTWDYCMAKNFAGEEGEVMSISYEAYKEWNPFKDFTTIESNKEAEPLLFGFCTYSKDREPSDDNKSYYYAWNNNLMIEQKGAVIFWPWNYTVEEMETNCLGKTFDFRLDCKK
ncbi:MAG: hypothetical protein FWC91_13605 [Defluviitaleaceae bacterium]|nr:hypothetical protein [Defluviitaleaceae bacterium]